MRVAFTALLPGLCLAACATLPAAQPPNLPPGVYGAYEDNDTGAINQSAWAFASPANTRGNPITAIKAVIALEYLPIELKENPRWVGMDGAVRQRLFQARQDVREILGIRPDAPAQLVVKILLQVASDLQAADPASALRLLGAPVFTLPPDRTLRLLSNLPYVRTANLATSRAESEMLPPGGARG